MKIECNNCVDDEDFPIEMDFFPTIIGDMEYKYGVWVCPSCGKEVEGHRNGEVA